MSVTYDLVWACLEIVHDMQEGDARSARAYIDKRLAADDADARRAVNEFTDACFLANLPIDPAYDID